MDRVEYNSGSNWASYFGMQGPKLRLTGRQCDQELSVGDQSSKTGRQRAITLLSPWHLKFQGKRAFLKRKQDSCGQL